MYAHCRLHPPSPTGCRDLKEQAGKKRSRGCGCPYRAKDEEKLVSDRLLTSALIIADVEDASWNSCACPYFGVRQAVSTGDADVIGVIYSLMSEIE